MPKNRMKSAIYTSLYLMIIYWFAFAENGDNSGYWLWLYSGLVICIGICFVHESTYKS